jgi:hypothetical protein
VGVNKHMEGETVICKLCHKEGHKSFQCKVKTGDKQRQKLKQNLQHLSQQGGQKGSYTILNHEANEWTGDSNQGQQASQQRKGGQMHLSAKRNYFNY